MAARLPDGRGGQMLALALTAAVAAGLWFAVAAPLLGWHTQRADSIAQRATVARRMAEVADTLPDLQRSGSVQAATAPAASLIGGETDAIAAADLQQRVQEMASRVGAALSSTEVLSTVQLGGYRRIGLRVSTNATWATLVQLLQSIGQTAPRMLVDDLQLRGQRLVAPLPDPPLDASFTVMAFRAAAASAARPQ